MAVVLTGSAGTGDTILNNWSLFSYKLDGTKSSPDMYYFDVEFNEQIGVMQIFIKDNKVDQSTVIDCDFPRPLGAYNDTTDFNEGLYLVAEKMLRSLSLKPFA